MPGHMKARKRDEGKGEFHQIGTSRTYLGRVHLEFPHHLDGSFAVLAGVVFGAIHIAESTVTHFFEQSPSIQARIFGQFALTLPLFCYDALDDGGIHFLIAWDGSVSDLHLLLITSSSGSSITCLRSAIAIINICNREVGRSTSVMLKRLVVENVGI